MINDEWTLIDSLGYENVVNNLVKTIKNVQPPFSLGIYGGWGSGKTSLMKQVYYRVGGKTKSYLFPFSTESENEEINKENKIIIDDLTPDLDYEAIWFNPWKHEMESNPLLGLLHEVRDHFDLFTKTGDEAKKLSDVSIRTGLDILTNTIKAITDIDFSVSSIETHGAKYENKNFETKSNTQNFRIIFEQAIKKLLSNDEDKKLIIFIDDLDRCADSKIIKLLEGIKLYLSVSNCIFIFGLDQNNVSRALKNNNINDEYLDKLFQSVIRIPVSNNYEKFIKEKIINKYFNDITSKDEFANLLTNLLEKNPRKIKNFMNSMKFHWDIKNIDSLDIEVFTLFHYLRMYYEDIFEILERDHEKINALINVCKNEPANTDIENFFSERLKNLITKEVQSNGILDNEGEVLLNKFSIEDFNSIKNVTLKFKTIDNFKEYFADKCGSLGNDVDKYLGVIK